MTAGSVRKKWMTTKIAPPPTARNATSKVPTRTGRDICHHLASSRRVAHTIQSGGHRFVPMTPEANDCTDSAAPDLSAAIVRGSGDENVMVTVLVPAGDPCGLNGPVAGTRAGSSPERVLTCVGRRSRPLALGAATRNDRRRDERGT